MEFVILDSTALLINGRPVPLGATKQRALLGILLYHAGDPVRIDTIVDHLWENRSTESCRPSLYAMASRVRATLRAVGLPDSLVRVRGLGAYRLDVDRELVDWHRLRHRVREARQTASGGDHRQVVALLSDVVRVDGHEPLADLRGASAEHLRRDVEETVLAGQRLLAGSLLTIGEHAAALARMESLIRLHPVDEGLAKIWAEALTAAGRGEDARAFAVEFRRRYRRVTKTDPEIDPADYRHGVRHSDPEPAAVVVGGHSNRLAVVPRQLPKAVSDFTGHDQILAQLDRLLAGDTEGANAVVLTGMPGVGKTTLVVHWAHRRRDRFPDGQLYLNAEAHGLIPPLGNAEALGRLLGAFGVPPDAVPAGIEQRRQRLDELLASRRVLIVLDNVLNSDQARPLLPTSDTCLTILTSRSRLKGLTIREGIPCVTVPPLPEPESRLLLGRVIGAARADAQPAALRRLGRLSGGLPLGLRIIGEHIVARPRAALTDLVDELGTRLLDCESDETGDASLRTFFAWSYNALDPAAARMFRLLGLFPGPTMAVAAAGALAGVDVPDAERLLNTLARVHLINHDVARHYRLHDLLRLYTADRVQQEEPASCRDDALRRLLDWYLLSAAAAAAALAPELSRVPDLPAPGTVAPMDFATDAEAMRWCESERTNLAALVRVASRHGFHRYAWQIPGTVHDIFDRYGRQDDMLESLRLALDAATADGHQIGRIGTLNNLGAIHFARHDYPVAERYFAEALRLSDRIGYPEGQQTCPYNLASVYLKTGQIATAIGLYHRVLRDCRESGYLPGQASTLQRMGDAYRRLGRPEQAGRHYLSALGIWERVGSLRGQGAAHARLAALLLDTGQPRLALDHCEMALAAHEGATDEANRCEVLITAADARRLLGDKPAAVRDATDAATIAATIADGQRRAGALAALVDALIAVGDRQRASMHCREALGIIGDINDPEIHAVLERLLVAERLLHPDAPEADAD